jgi:hypothetical protein
VERKRGRGGAYEGFCFVVKSIKLSNKKKKKKEGATMPWR